MSRQRIIGVLLAAGLAALLLAGALLWLKQAGSEGQGSQVSDGQLAALESTIADVRAALQDADVRESARRALAGAELAPLREALQSAGVGELIDVQVFSPPVEEIPTGSYPEPDFAVVQMLVAARRQSLAPAQVHYSGGPNENLAFAAAIPDADGDTTAGYLFLRLPVSTVTSRLETVDEEQWLILQQDDQVIASIGEVPAQIESAGRTVPGSQLQLLAGRGGYLQGLPAALIYVIAGLGLALLLGAAGYARRRSEPETGAPAAEDQAADAPKPTPAEPAAEPAAASRELPDWMLDEASDEGEDGPFGGAPQPTESKGDASGAAKADDDLFDVPDLDEILEQIEDEEAPEEATGGDDATASPSAAETEVDDDLSAGAEGRGDDDGDASSGLDLDLPGDEVTDLSFPDASDREESPAPSEAEAKPEPEPGEEHPSEAEEAKAPESDAALDLDFAFSGDLGAAAQEGESEEKTTPTETPGVPEPTEASHGADQADADEPSESAPSNEPAQPEALELSEPEETGQDAAPEAPPSEAESEFELDFEPEPGPEPEPEPELAPEPEPEPESESESEPEPEPESDPSAAEADLVAGVLPPQRGPGGLYCPGSITGEVDADLTTESATAVGFGLGRILVERGFSRMAVARDGRISGPILLSALTRGLRNAGIDVIEVGAVPTPLLWFAAAELSDGCAAMVTASSQPAEFNGFRLRIGGRLPDAETMRELAERVAEPGHSEAGEEGGYEQQDVLERYVSKLLAGVQLERPLKVVVDCGNGIGGAVLPGLVKALGADLIPLYCDIDGSFPNHRPDPASPEELEDLRLCVRNFQADLGLALDGDGDRLALVSSNGELVSPDRLLMLLARDQLERQDGASIVFDARCSGHLVDWIERHGGQAVMAPAGAVAVAEAVLQSDAPFGGDRDGHLVIRDGWYPFEDAIHAAARLLSLLAATRRSVEAVVADLPNFTFSRELALRTDYEHSRHLLVSLAREADFGDARCTRPGGLRVDWDDRWGLARIDPESGQLLLRFGGDDAAALGRVRNHFREQLLAIDSGLKLPY